VDLFFHYFLKTQKNRKMLAFNKDRLLKVMKGHIVFLNKHILLSTLLGNIRFVNVLVLEAKRLKK